MNCELSSLVSTIWDLIGSLNNPKNCPKPLKKATLGTSKHPTQAKSILIILSTFRLSIRYHDSIPSRSCPYSVFVPRTKCPYRALQTLEFGVDQDVKRKLTTN